MLRCLLGGYIQMLPFVAVAGILYLLTKGVFFLILTIILIIAYIWLIIYSIKECRKPYDPTMAPMQDVYDDSDEAAEAALSSVPVYSATT